MRRGAQPCRRFSARWFTVGGSCCRGEPAQNSRVSGHFTVSPACQPDPGERPYTARSRAGSCSGAGDERRWKKRLRRRPGESESGSFFVFGGGPYLAATHADASPVGPTGLYPGKSTPAQPGEPTVVYANGFGPTSTPVVSGSPTQSGTLKPPPTATIGIGAAPATVQFARLVSPGLYQLNVVVPTSTSSGDNAVSASYNGLTTQSGILLTVGP
jgi:hypothetical protein